MSEPRSHTFGWCNDGHCGRCPGTITTFYVDERTGKPHTTGSRTCEHPCHREETTA